jgi:hypothetical protein
LQVLGRQRQLFSFFLQNLKHRLQSLHLQAEADTVKHQQTVMKMQQNDKAAPSITKYDKSQVAILSIEWSECCSFSAWLTTARKCSHGRIPNWLPGQLLASSTPTAQDHPS